jgi:hypothetical protein
MTLLCVNRSLLKEYREARKVFDETEDARQKAMKNAKAHHVVIPSVLEPSKYQSYPGTVKAILFAQMMQFTAVEDVERLAHAVAATAVPWLPQGGLAKSSVDRKLVNEYLAARNRYEKSLLHELDEGESLDASERDAAHAKRMDAWLKYSEKHLGDLGIMVKAEKALAEAIMAGLQEVWAK